MLRPGRLVEIDAGEVLLRENDASANLHTVCLEGIRDVALVLRMDGTEAQKLLISARGENRRCDYIMFLHRRGSNFIIFIELKTSYGEANPDKLLMKYRGTDCILAYCESIIDSFYERPDSLRNYQKRYVCMYRKPSIHKRPTRISDRVLNDEPDHPLLLPVDNYVSGDPGTKVKVDNLFL